jgi:hypothetical protein
MNRRILTMSQKFHHLIPGIVLMAATVLATSLASAQAPTLQEQLAAQYKLVKMGSDTSGYSVVEKGTLLAIQKGGILAVPYSDSSVLSTKYEGGSGTEVHHGTFWERADDPLVCCGRQSLSHEDRREPG